MPVTQLMDALDGLRRRAKFLSVLFGVGVVIAAAVAALLVTVALDYLMNLPALPRLVVLLAAFAAVAFLGWRHIARPLLSRVTLGDVAGRVEMLYPQFEDRLRSAVQFEDAHDQVGSERMRRKVTQQAAEIAGRVDLGRAVRTRPALLSLGGGAAAVTFLVLAALLVGSTYRTIIATRLAAPFGAPAWPTAQVVRPGDVPAKVPAGRRFEVSMTLDKGDRVDLKPILYYRTAGGAERQVFMQRGPDGRYAATLDARLAENAAAGAIAARIVAGDDEKVLPEIAVVPRLKIESIAAVVTPPPYVGDRPAETIDLSRGPAVTADGATVELQLAFNKPLSSQTSVALVPVESPVPDVEWQVGSGSAEAVGQWVARQGTRFRVAATDADGFENAALSTYEIVVRPDQTPTVMIERPRRSERRTAAATLPLRAVVEDDFGFDAIELAVEKLAAGDEEPVRWNVPLMAEDNGPAAGVGFEPLDDVGGRQRLRVSYDWLLNALDGAELEPGDVLEYFVRVQDNYDLDGVRHSPVESNRLRVTIISQEELANEVLDDVRLVKDQVTQVRNRQKRTEQETRDLKEQTQEQAELDEADEAAAGRLVRDQANAAGAAKKLAGRVGELQQRLAENAAEDADLRELTEEVARNLDAAAEGPMKRATGELDDAQANADAAEPRNENLDAAAKQQQQAAEMLDAAVARMGNVGSLKGAIEDVRELLEKQRAAGESGKKAGEQAVGKEKDDLTGEQQKALEAAAAEQEKVAADTDQAAEALEKLAEQMEQSDPAAAAAMKQAAREMRQQQLSQQQRQAAQKTRDNQQADARRQQQQIEIGLQVVLNELREAEARQLRELQRQLAELEEQLEVLSRRQAGHNVDNLTLRGEDAVAAAAERLAELLGQADRLDAEGNAAPPEAGLSARTLTNSQGQTERNARSVAAEAEKLPEGAEPAAKLTRAAGLMERAAVALSNEELADAFPTQEEALAALGEAQDQIAEQKQKVDEEIADQQREAIRERYVKVRAAQAELNEQTAAVDGKRDDAGDLDRAGRIALNQLPAEQGTLQDQIDELAEDLATVGSVVYLWANKDIRDTMGEVKGRLGQGQSGGVVRAEQGRVVQQLDAMIENLKAKPPGERFEEAGGGGGGGGQCQGGPKMPASAELRLLRDLQNVVNDGTEQVAEVAKDERDKQTLVRLGERQGGLRGVLDEMLQKSSQGQMKLGPEPDNRDLLPEEADEAAVEENELMGELLGGEDDTAGQEAQANRIGDRMARSRQRLALNQDPGQTTQIIQERILEDFQDLIQQAEEQEKTQQSSSQQQQQQQQAQQQPAPKPGQQQAQAGQKSAGQSTAPGEGPAPDGGEEAPPAQAGIDNAGDIAGQGEAWGSLTPRQRQAILDGQSETTLSEYQKLVGDYFKGLSERANQP